MRRRLPSHGLDGSAWITVFVSAALLVGCERHIDEPTPVRPLDPTTVTIPPAPVASATATATAAIAAPDGVPAGRCVRPTPATPKRTAKPGPDPSCPKDPETPPKLKSGKVSFPGANDASV